MDLYKSAFYGYWGKKIDKGCDDSKLSSQGFEFECAKLEKPENIAGISACLWTEEIIGKGFNSKLAKFVKTLT